MTQIGRRGLITSTLAAGAVLPAKASSTWPLQRPIADAGVQSGGSASLPRICHFFVPSGDDPDAHPSELWNVESLIAEGSDQGDQPEVDADGCPISARTEDEHRFFGRRAARRFLASFEALEKATARNQMIKPIDLAVVYVQRASHFQLAIAETLIGALKHAGAFTMWIATCVDREARDGVLPADQLAAATCALGDARLLLDACGCRWLGDDRLTQWALERASSFAAHRLRRALYPMSMYPDELLAFRGAVAGLRRGWFGRSGVRPWRDVLGALDETIDRAALDARTYPVLSMARFAEITHGPDVPLDRLSEQLREQIGTDAATMYFRPFRSCSGALEVGLDVIQIRLFGEGELY